VAVAVAGGADRDGDDWMAVVSAGMKRAGGTLIDYLP
jgi:hypothetical protein